MKSHLHRKQRIQKIVILLLIFVFSFANSISVFADSGSESLMPNSSEFKLYTDQIDQQLAIFKADPHFSAAQKEAAVEKAELLKGLLSGRIVVQPRSSSCINYVPFYHQIEDNYCGPASIQQTLGHYDYAPMPDQKYIYDETHSSELSDMIEFLNSRLNPGPDPDPTYVYYQAWWNHSSKNMQTTITSIAGTGTPIIAHISVGQAGRTSYTDTRHWPYTTDGHYLSISGYYNNGGQIQVTDPFILWTSAGKSDSRYNGGKYQIDFDVLDATCDRLIL